jgi:hypothetical protein
MRLGSLNSIHSVDMEDEEETEEETDDDGDDEQEDEEEVEKGLRGVTQDGMRKRR